MAKIQYVAFDGTPFENMSQCEVYEEKKLNEMKEDVIEKVVTDHIVGSVDPYDEGIIEILFEKMGFFAYLNNSDTKLVSDLFLKEFVSCLSLHNRRFIHEATKVEDFLHTPAEQPPC